MSAAGLLQGTFASADEFCDELFAFLATAGQSRYDDTVTQLDHALQTAALAEAEGGAFPGRVAQIAALLHDIGHLVIGEHDARDDFLAEDLHHETAGARYLTRWFGPAVGAPVALHVDAKRYLVATEPGYAASLSAASTRSLQLQGGPMSRTEAAGFRRRPGAGLAIALRRWDDRAKDPHASVPRLGHWRSAICTTFAAAALRIDTRARCRRQDGAPVSAE